MLVAVGLTLGVAELISALGRWIGLLGASSSLFVQSPAQRGSSSSQSLLAQPSWHMENRYTDGVAANALVSYTEQMIVNQATLSLAINQAVTLALQFHAREVTDPVAIASRVSGPADAYPEIAKDLFDATCGMWLSRVMKESDASTLIAEVNAATITLALGGQARKQLATCGAAGYDFGYFTPSISLTPYFARAATMAAVSALTDCRYEALLSNGQGALLGWHVQEYPGLARLSEE